VLSVVIPTYNEAGYLGAALEALAPQLRTEDDVIVVDSFSTDATVRIAEVHGARVLQMPRHGIGAAKALGMDASRAPVVGFLDADAVPARDWVARIKGHFAGPEVLAVAGLALYGSDGAARRATYNVFASGVWSLGAAGYAILRVPWLPVNNCAFRKEVVADRGGFRSVVCEDVDFAMRARGLPGVVYDPGLRVTLSDRRFQSRSFLGQVLAWAHADLRVFLGRPFPTDGYGAPR